MKYWYNFFSMAFGLITILLFFDVIPEPSIRTVGIGVALCLNVLFILAAKNC